MELILRVAIEEHVIHVFSRGALVFSLFSLSISFLFVAISNLFKKKVKLLLGSLFLLFFGIIYASQLVYHDVFRTFYSFYSAANVGQALGFFDTILNTIGSNIVWILILFIPPLLFVVFGKKVLSNKRIPIVYSVAFAISFIFVHLLGLFVITYEDEKQNSAYDLYYNSSSPVLSVEKLGLLTTMRLDLQRQLTNWSPVIEPPSIAVGNTYVPSEEVEEDVEVDDGNNNESKETEPEIEPEYNVLDIDFDALIENTEDETLRMMHQYFKNVKPTEKNEYTGKFKGYNLIMLTAEGFAPYAVSEELTPTLYKMSNQGYQFTDFYVPLWGVSTSDGEYVALTSLIPKKGVWSFSESSKNHLPFVMGNQFKRLDYKTVAYHNHTFNYYDRDLSHPNMGYEYKGIGNGLDVKKIWPGSDLEMMEETVDEYVNDAPFHAYYMTMSGHLEYNFGGNNMALKNKSKVDHLDYSSQAKAYVATQIELDRALEYLINQLEEAGVMDNTLFVLSADHYPYGLEYETIDELTGKSVDRNFGIYKSDLIIYAKGMEEVVIDEPVSSLDIIPTVSNLLGLEYDSRLLMGRDVFSNKEPLVLFEDKSFITVKGKYNATTGEFMSNSGENPDQAYIDFISAKVNEKYYYSTQILDKNYYDIVINQ